MRAVMHSTKMPLDQPGVFSVDQVPEHERYPTERSKNSNSRYYQTRKGGAVTNGATGALHFGGPKGGFRAIW